jgi:O-antigen/teichoic acid export membrane protein
MRAQRSLGRTGLIRLTAELAGAGGALLTSAITARNLGPADKGVLATLSFVAVAAAAVGGLGLGEALTSVRARAKSPGAEPAFLVLLAAGAALGCLLAILSGVALFASRWEDFNGSVLVAGMAAGAYTLLTVAVTTADGSGLAARAGLSRVVVAAVMVPTTLLLVTFLDFAVVGALAAMTLAWAAGLAVLVVPLIRRLLPERRRPTRAELRRLARSGLPIQLSTTVFVLSTRADLLMVQALRGDTAAGLYGVSVTAASVATYPALSLTAAALPRVSAATGRALADAAGKALRAVLLISVLAAAALAVVVPVVIPAAFGRGFAQAVVPTVVLLLGTTGAGVQWAAGRTVVTHGGGRWVLGACASSLMTMLAFDLVLVPRWGVAGAASAAVCAAYLGAGVALRGVLVVVPELDLRDLVPRQSDVRSLMTTFSRAAPGVLSRPRPDDGGSA